MKRSRRRRIVLFAVAGVPLVLVGILVLYLAFADLGRHRGLVEDLVTDVLGRRLRIEGRFEARLLSLTPSVVAEDVSLANPDWGAEPSMVHVDRLEGSIVLGSIFSGPIRIRELKVEGAQVRLESDGAGGASWDFDLKPSDRKRPDAEVPRPPIIFEQVSLQDVEFSLRNLSTDGVIELDLGSVRLDPDGSGAYQVTIDGHVNDTPFDLRGTYGTVEWFIVFEAAEYDLRGRLAEIDFAIAGQMANLLRLDGSDSTVELNGPDIADLTETFGLPSLGAGPFALSGKAVADEDGTDVDLEARLGEVDAAAHGHLASLTSIDDLDLEIEGAGPDLRAFGALFGAGHLPAKPFSASGRLQRRDGTTVFEGVEARLGDNSLKVDGTIGKLPALVGTDVTVTASGDDLSELSSVVKARLPRGAYQVRGRLVRNDAAVELHDVRLTLGKSELSADGTVTVPPRFAGSDLAIKASGPDLSAFSSLAGVNFPPRSFEIEGGLKAGEERFEFESVRARLGETALRLSGSAPRLTDLDGVDAVVHAAGPDLAEVLAMAGLDGLPTDRFEIEGRVRVAGKRFRLTDVAATVGDLTARLDGTIAAVEGFVGTDVEIAASGGDLSRLGRYAAYEPLPADPYALEGRLRVDRDGYDLEQVAAEVGELSATVGGRVGREAGFGGSDLHIEVRGARLSDLAGFGDLPQLPALPFSVAGGVAIDDGTYRLESVSGTLGANRIEVEGLLGPFPDLDRTEISLRASGPDLAEVATAVEDAAEIDLPDLPPEEFGVSGRVRAVDGRYELTEIETRLGEAKMTAHGWVGAPPEFHGTDVTLQAGGPQASLIAAIAGLSLPDESFRVEGRVLWLETGARFHDFRAQVGSHSLRVDGSVGRLPKLVGTELDVHISGPEPQLIGQIVDLPRLPAEPYDVAAHFEGTPDKFTLRGLRASLGNSDLSGELSVDLRGKPIVRGRFTSRRLDLVPFLPEEVEDEIEELEAGGSLNQKEGQPNREKKRRVISDEPFDFQALHDQDADIELSIDSLTSRRSSVSKFELRLKLTDGHLRIDPVSAVGSAGAVFTASLDLEPLDGTYRFETRLGLDDARVEFLSHGADPQKWPPIDLRFDLSGEGRSPRELAASLNGYATLDVGTGSLDPSILDLLVFDALTQLMEALNPFRKEDKITEMECAVIVARVEDGRTVIEPLALRTDKMTVAGHGTINLQNEKLDLDWTAKPRKGIGVSVNVIVNPYVKIGGTLGNPNLEVKPLRAATATGVAVATAGVSLLARGLWDRVTAEKKICKSARKQVKEIKEEIDKGGGE